MNKFILALVASLGRVVAQAASLFSPASETAKLAVLRVSLQHLALSVIVATSASADEPFVSYIFPAGGQRGTTVSFNVGGHNLHEKCPFEMLGSGVEASKEIHRAAKTVWFEGPVIPQPASQRKEDYPKDQAGSVKIAADAPLGLRRWRVWTSQGATQSMKFVIGDLPEIVEKEIDGDPIPVPVELPVTINGRMFPREDVNVWTFDARAGSSYTCEVMAARLGSPLDSRLEVIGPHGERVAENTDSRGADSFLRFTASTDGAFQVRIHDINFEGLQHYVYRLTITDGPYVDHVYPLGGRRGAKVNFQLLGQNVPQQPLEIQLPATQAELYTHEVNKDGTRSNPFTIELSDLPERLEVEPNDDAQKAAPVPLPAVLNGRIDRPGDKDAWRFEAKKGDVYVVDLRAAQLGSHLDSVLTITDSQGKQLSQSDDIAAGKTDSRLTFKVAADGVYTATVTERFEKRGGPEFAYRLHISPPVTETLDFQLQLPVDALTLNRGAEAKLKLTAERHGGFNGEIALKIENLPAGVTVTGDKIAAKKNDVQLVFKAEKTAKIQTARLKIVGTAKIADRNVTRAARKIATSRDDLDIDHLLLAVAIPTPFKVPGVFETKYAARGSTYVRHYVIDRGGFEGPITISMADRQVRHLQGVTGPTIVVPPGESEFDYPIQLQPWMVIGRTSRTCVMAVGVIEEPDGTKHKVSSTSHEQADQIIVLVDPGQLDVRSNRKSLVARAGESVELMIDIGRGKGIQGPVRVKLVVPEHIRGITAEPITVAANQSQGKLTLRFETENIGPLNMPMLIRATATSDGHPYIAETKVDIIRPK